MTFLNIEHEDCFSIPQNVSKVHLTVLRTVALRRLASRRTNLGNLCIQRDISYVSRSMTDNNAFLSTYRHCNC